MTHLEQTASPGTERGRHTPGPWSRHNGSNWSDGEWKITAPDAEGNFPWTIAMTFSGAGFHRLEGEAESQANARLIAAAPTMLGAFYTFPDPVDFRDAEAFRNAVLDWWGLTACPAMALAEGRTPTETKGGASDE